MRDLEDGSERSLGEVGGKREGYGEGRVKEEEKEEEDKEKKEEEKNNLTLIKYALCIYYV